ncbi:hypothetical protein PQX77_015727 [Marasmius sp. AFHP31]|nr:hypothetical protein PQX77_015727 [Marasmius sp. AFHP31]
MSSAAARSTAKAASKSAAKAKVGPKSAVMRKLLARESELEESLVMTGPGHAGSVLEMQIAQVRAEIEAMHTKSGPRSANEESTSSLSSLSDSGAESEHDNQPLTSSSTKQMPDEATTSKPTVQNPIVKPTSRDPTITKTATDSPKKRGLRESGPPVRSSKRLRKGSPSPPAEAKEVVVPIQDKINPPVPTGAARKAGARRPLRELPSRDAKKAGGTTVKANGTATPSIPPPPRSSLPSKGAHKLLPTGVSTLETKTTTEVRPADSRSLIEEDEKEFPRKRAPRPKLQNSKSRQRPPPEIATESSHPQSSQEVVVKEASESRGIGPGVILPKEKSDAEKDTRNAEAESVRDDSGSVKTPSETPSEGKDLVIPDAKERQVVHDASGAAVASPNVVAPTTDATSTTVDVQAPGRPQPGQKAKKKDGPSRQRPTKQNGTGTRCKPSKRRKAESKGNEDASGEDDDLEIVDRNLLDAEILTRRAVQDYLSDPRDENRLSINARVHIKAAAGHCPEAGISCWDLARDCLVTKRGQIKCIYHLQVDRSRKWDDTEKAMKGIPYEPVAPITVQEDSTTGSYERLRVPRGKDFEPYCHCGCRLEDAVWGLYLWKTGRIAYHGQEDYYDVPPTPAQRNFEITRLKSLGIELDDLWTHVHMDGYYRKRTDDELLDLRVRRILGIKKGKDKAPAEESQGEEGEADGLDGLIPLQE